MDQLVVYRPAAAMLGAYAIETLLKMVIVGEYCLAYGLEFDAVKRAKDFLPPIDDLVELSKRAGLRINKAVRDLLKVLSGYPHGGVGIQSPRRQRTLERLARLTDT